MRKEARYEGDHSNVPVTLPDLDDLARLIEMHYRSSTQSAGRSRY